MAGLNEKVAAYFKKQVEDQKMSQEYADKLLDVLKDAPDDIQAGWLSQQDYQRNMNELKGEREAFNQEKEKWTKWYDDTNTAAKERKQQLEEAVNQRAELQKQVEELQTKLQAGGLDPDDENAAQKLIGDMKTEIAGLKTQLESALTPEKLDEVLNKKSQGLVNFMDGSWTELQAIRDRHNQTFGTVFDMNKDKEALLAFMNEKADELGHPITLTQAYDMKYADEYRKKWEDDKTTELRKEIEEEVRTQHGVPTSPDGTPIPQGGQPSPFQDYMSGKRPADLPEDASQHDVAMAAAAALRAEGKS